jgi:penicillin-binding protein 1C
MSAGLKLSWLATRWSKRVRVVKVLFGLLFAIGLGLVALWAVIPFVPLPENLFTGPVPSLEFVDRDNRPLRLVMPDGGPFRERLTFAEIPLPLIHATLASEDRRFWQHAGVDWKASLRAVWQLAANRRIISGGSTITQQLIKQAQPRPRTFRTKFIEAFQALRLEQVWDKQSILADYLNRIDYGNYNVGCAAAALFYFAKPLRDLSPAECALLAGLPQRPSRLNPYANFARARKRQQWILQRMNACGWLTDEDYRRAKAEPLCLAKPHRTFEAPHFIELLLAQEPVRVQEDSRVRTSLDLELNRFAEETLDAQLSRLAAKNVRNGSIVVLDNQTGHVLAMVGSRDYFASDAGQVNGAWAVRSAGSALKPFTYLLAFEKGTTPASVVADVPTEFPTATGLFAPVNFNRHCYGPVRCRISLANSLNIAAVKVLELAGGPEALRRKMQDCGITTLVKDGEYYGLGLTIGNAEVRLLELANAYACLARLGQFKPYSLLCSSGGALARTSRQVADPTAAYLIADILSDNAARNMAFGAESPLRFDFPVACKTGTSSDFRDNWAFGYTPEFTVGVWVGNFDGSPMQNVSGVSGAAPILHSVFEHLHQCYGTSWYAVPAGVTETRIHAVTGKRVGPENHFRARSSDIVHEKFVSSALPPFEEACDYDAFGRVRLGSDYDDWFASSDNWLGGRAVVDTEVSGVRVVFPPPGTTIYLDPDLPNDGRRLYLQADGPSTLLWTSSSLECRREGNQTIALLTEGRHDLAVRDPRTDAEARTWVNVTNRRTR